MKTNNRLMEYVKSGRIKATRTKADKITKILNTLRNK